MKRLALLAALVFIPALPSAAAAVAQHTVVHVADGDCTGLQQALNLGAESPGGIEKGPTGELIVLARNGSYVNCFYSSMTVSGAFTIEGSGATILLGYNPNTYGSLSDFVSTPVATQPGFLDTSGSPIIFRHVNFVLNPGEQVTGAGSIQSEPGLAWQNSGSLIIESSSITLGANCAVGSDTYSYRVCDAKAMTNTGSIVLRNVTVTNAATTSTLPAYQSPFIDNNGPYSINNENVLGTVRIEQSTISLNKQLAFLNGVVTSSNSILTATANALCSIVDSSGRSTVTSLGGNLFSDSSCGYNASTDQIVADAGLADFGNHGGVVSTFALNFNSPARGVGVAADCAATDARGAARGSAHCDAGAYEFGGGSGQLDESGMSGLYYDPAHDGHYVTVQKLDFGSALVIWNTFDKTGAPAWLYGVGTVIDNTIHVTDVAQNLGGVLQPGGTVIGSKATSWGSFDFIANDCLSATLVYHSPHPDFGFGSIKLTRLALIDGLDCSQ